MKTAYDELMEKIEVTPEMRQRVLEHIAQEDITPVSSKVARFPAIGKYISIAACFALLLAGTAVLPRLLDRGGPEPPVLTAPNIVEAGSVEELSELVGFEVTTEFSLPFEVEKTAYRSYWNEMAEIEYSGGECSATYRQSQGSEDNSGDYNLYKDTTGITVKGRNVTLKGNDGIYVLAVWTNGAYSCSMSVSPGASADVWATMLSGAENH